MSKKLFSIIVLFICFFVVDFQQSFAAEKIRIEDFLLIDNQREAVQESQGKDFWEIFVAISGFLSSVIIAFLGLYFTQVYRKTQIKKEKILQEKQIQIKKIEIIKDFTPHLIGTEEQKEIAILCINALGAPDLAIKISELIKSPGTINALKRIEGLSDKEDKRKAKKALDIIFEETKNPIVKIIWKDKFLGETREEMKGNGFLISNEGLILTLDFVVGTSKEILVENESLGRKTAKLIYKSPNNRVVLLKIKGNNYNFLEIENRQLEDNEGVLLNAINAHTDEGLILYGNYLRDLNNDLVFNIPEAKGKGLAGSPVIGLDKKVLGVLSYSMRNPETSVGAVSAIEILNVIDSYKNSPI